MIKTCAHCGKDYSVKGKKIERSRFCSKPCRYEHARLNRHCTHCKAPISRPQSLVGPRQRVIFCDKECTKAYWLEHGGYLGDDGYQRVNVDGKRMLRSHAVMRQVLGRDLLPGENVHHINGVRNDDRPENLELWSRAQPPGQRVQDKLQWALEFATQYGVIPRADSTFVNGLLSL